ncbi:MAG: preprotein translocase subunit SecA [Patescibacteria group bacterium]
MSFIGKIFGDGNKRVLDKLLPILDQVNKFEESVKTWPDAKFIQKTNDYKRILDKTPEKLDEILPEAFAMVREAAKRALGQRHFDMQILGGLVLHQGKIAEMKTGEGKTLVATAPLYLNALTGQGCHLVTVNDYLAKRDCGWMGPVYHLLGISVAAIVHEEAFIYDPDFENKEAIDPKVKHLKPISRRDAYAADITYGTNNEFGFDYLRDNMVPDLPYMVQRELNYAIVDEVDSILIDEARTPLIISAPAEESTEMYYKFSQLIPELSEGTDYNIDEKMRAATLTEEGMNKMEKKLGLSNIYEAGGIELVHHMEQALKAHALFKRDRDYVVKEGEIIIVDEFTGRLMFGRRYSEGLHQAIEAKENVEIKKESQTLATISFQNYFRIYKKLAGMTGTAATEAEEFHKIYNLEVIVVPTNKPMIRKDSNDSIYKSEKGKFVAIVREIKRRHEIGQPVLVGTISIEKNELLAELLEREGIPHNVLNAKQHEKEAQFIAQAGKLGAVTVATNMAGRGVDIVLGGNPFDEEEAKKVKEIGGLHVLGTERHESRRIDNQLRGRTGRQGDPGSSQFFISLEDDLMRIFGSGRMKSFMDRLGVPDDMPIENKMISRSIESAQKKVEGNNFDIRKHLVEYDDVMNKHREVIYKKRREMLETKVEDLRKTILKMVEDEVEQVVSFHTSSEDERTWNLDEIYEVVDTIFPVPLSTRVKLEDIRQKAGDKAADARSRTAIIKYLLELSNKAYDHMVEHINDANFMHQIERGIILRTIDSLWIEHLDQMNYLRTGIGLRGYGQQDPLVEYKKEAFQMFTQLMNNINAQIVYSIFKITLAQKMAPSPMQRDNISVTAPAKVSVEKNTNVLPDNIKTVAKETTGNKVGRNDPCPCGSGKKYKRCHGA